MPPPPPRGDVDEQGFLAGVGSAGSGERDPVFAPYVLLSVYVFMRAVLRERVPLTRRRIANDSRRYLLAGQLVHPLARTDGEADLLGGRQQIVEPQSHAFDWSLSRHHQTNVAVLDDGSSSFESWCVVDSVEMVDLLDMHSRSISHFPATWAGSEGCWY